MSSAPAVERTDAYRTHLQETVLVKRMRVKSRNREVRMWGLISKRFIQCGSFIGFYSGDTSSLTCPDGSLYSLDVGPSQPCIVPFSDESQITPSDRDRHPLASMNEPSEGEYANTHLAVQDFTHAEIHQVETIPHQEQAQFFRAMAAFACRDIQSGEALTWWYGTAYAPIREQQGYTAGFACQRVLNEEVFIKAKSQAVLEVLGERGCVPSYCVFPVLRSQTLKSARFKRHRRHTTDSDGEESESFSSGSSYEEPYHPRPSMRRKTV